MGDILLAGWQIHTLLLLWENMHTVKVTILAIFKCKLQHSYAYLHFYILSPPSRTFPSCKMETLSPLNSRSPLPSLLVTANLPSVSISYEILSYWTFLWVFSRWYPCPYNSMTLAESTPHRPFQPYYCCTHTQDVPMGSCLRNPSQGTSDCSPHSASGTSRYFFMILKFHQSRIRSQIQGKYPWFYCVFPQLALIWLELE